MEWRSVFIIFWVMLLGSSVAKNLVYVLHHTAVGLWVLIPKVIIG